jgi:hypothetical protein
MHRRAVVAIGIMDMPEPTTNEITIGLGVQNISPAAVGRIGRHARAVAFYHHG